MSKNNTTTKDKEQSRITYEVLEDGRKVILACESGYRESKESWLEVLRDLKAEGLNFRDLQ